MKYTILIGCLILTGCSQYNQLFGGSSTAHKDYASITFVGAGQSNMVYENLSLTFPRSINIAEGGTAITEWQKGGLYYDRIIKACSNVSGPLVLLWWQGETEGIGSGLPDSWTLNYLKMVDDLRHDLNKDIPIVYVQIGHYQNNGVSVEGSTWQSVSDQQASLDGRNHMFMVGIKDLFPGIDGIHYTQESYKIVQQRILQTVQDKI